MSRLRNVQGVTRVSLSKSEKSAVAAGSGADVAGPCGKGAPPNFELVVFFEKATVGAALADATGEAAHRRGRRRRPGRRRQRQARRRHVRQARFHARRNQGRLTP